MENDVQAFEQKAREFVSLTLAVCEQELAPGSAAPTPPQTALAAAALSVRESVKTFLAVSAIPVSADTDKSCPPFFTTCHRKFLQHNLITKRTFRTCAG